MTTVVLIKEEIQEALDYGKQRQKYHEKVGTKDAHGFSGNGMKIHLQGACAERAVAKYLNKKWVGFKEDFKSIKADVGENIQVRSTNYPYGNLLIHPSDPDDHIFILVKTHNEPSMELVGWVYGKDAKQKEYWEDGTNWPAFKNRPCFRYPYGLLNSMETFPKNI